MSESKYRITVMDEADRVYYASGYNEAFEIAYANNAHNVEVEELISHYLTIARIPKIRPEHKHHQANDDIGEQGLTA